MTSLETRWTTGLGSSGGKSYLAKTRRRESMAKAAKRARIAENRVSLAEF
jgi:hypothetical protein